MAKKKGKGGGRYRGRQGGGNGGGYNRGGGRGRGGPRRRPGQVFDGRRDREPEFTENGEFVRTWGDFGSGPDQIGLAAGVAVAPEGFVWVTDAGNNRILRYTLQQ